MRQLFVVLLVMGLSSCSSKKELYHIPTFSKNNYVHCVIEIPSGTNSKIEFNKETKKFEVDLRDGKARMINFLPYPANYGFISSTYSNPTDGGDGDALDVIVISEALRTGSVLEIIPVGILKLIDDDEYDYKIIGVPADENLRIINVLSLNELKNKYPNILKILELWFLNYDKKDALETDGWGDEKEALLEIRTAMK